MVPFWVLDVLLRVRGSVVSHYSLSLTRSITQIEGMQCSKPSPRHSTIALLLEQSKKEALTFPMLEWVH